MAWNKIKDGLKDVAEKGVEVAGEKMEQRKEVKQEKKEQKMEDKQALKERLEQMDKEGIAYCPKCYSTNLSGNKRGFKLTTGIIGMNKVVITCMKCGNKFKPGK